MESGLACELNYPSRRSVVELSQKLEDQESHWGYDSPSKSIITACRKENMLLPTIEPSSAQNRSPTIPHDWIDSQSKNEKDRREENERKIKILFKTSNL